MKNHIDAHFFQSSHDLFPPLYILYFDKKHMRVMYTSLRNNWNIHRKPFQLFIVNIPNAPSAVINPIGNFQLRVQKRRIDLAWKIGRTNVPPTVFIHHSPVKTSAVRTFFPQYFRPFDIGFVIDQKSSALSHCVIFCFMKAVAAECSDCSQRFSFIR